MPNVIDPVLRHAAATPDHVAIRGAAPWTYAQLRDAALSFADVVVANGLRTGDRVLLAAPSVTEFVVAYLGIQTAGCVVVPVNTMSTAPEVEYVLTDAGASLAVVWHGLGPAVGDAAAAHAVPVVTLTELSAPTAPRAITVVDCEPDDTAAILYTSGTTGRPKGAQLTVANLLAAGSIGAASIHADGTDRIGTGLPLFHVFGQGSVMMTAFTAGASLSLLARFTPAAMVDLVRSDDLTVVAGVPTMWNAMVHAAAGVDTAAFATLQVAISGGASLPAAVAREFQQLFGCALVEGYGLTETTALATVSDFDLGPKIGYTGQAAADTLVQVWDGDGEVCDTGVVGEVYVHGPTVMKGYWNRPADTAAALSADGWFRTGDLGEFDDDGDLRIVDRAKDLIIRGGYNVYPSEVEEVLYSHPDVVEAAVLGVPDEYYGEEVAAVTVLVPDSTLTGEELTTWTREHLSAYKIPRIVQFVDALPKGPSGKILKRSIDRRPLVPDRH